MKKFDPKSQTVSGATDQTYRSRKYYGDLVDPQGNNISFMPNQNYVYDGSVPGNDYLPHIDKKMKQMSGSPEQRQIQF